ncbi:MAG: peroxiredoxin family protein [Spirochaetaceae bacterium]
MSADDDDDRGRGALFRELLRLRRRQLDGESLDEAMTYDLAAAAAAEARVAGTALQEGQRLDEATLSTLSRLAGLSDRLPSRETGPRETGSPETPPRGTGNPAGESRRPSGLFPLVLTWYLSDVSPFCVAALEELRRAWSRRSPAAGSLVVLTPQPHSRAEDTAHRLGLPFQPIHDDGSIGDAFGIRYTAPPAFTRLLALDAERLPLPATYLIGEGAVVRYAFLHPDPRFRAEPEHVLAAAAEEAQAEHGDS